MVDAVMFELPGQYWLSPDPDQMIFLYHQPPHNRKGQQHKFRRKIQLTPI